jgi:hypothetical protein
LLFPPYVCKNLAHGSPQEIKGFILAHFFYFNRCPTVCHLGALALAYAYYPVCAYFLCAGNGPDVSLGQALPFFVVVCTAHPAHGLSALMPTWGFEKVSPEHNFFKTPCCLFF